MKRLNKYFTIVILLIAFPQILNAQWSLVRFDEFNLFTKVETASPQTSFIAGVSPFGTGTFIMRTNDQGLTVDSIPLNTLTESYEISTLSFTDIDNGHAGGRMNSYQVLLSTNDNGSTWTNITPNPLLADAIVSVSFINPQSGFAASENTLYSTTDGGLSWTSVTTGFGVSEISFTDMNTGYACGTSNLMAVVMKTSDGGLTWTNILSTQFSFFPSSFMQTLDVINSNEIYASMQYVNKLFHSSNGGMSWDTITLSQISTITDYDFVSSMEGRVLSSMGEIFGTQDGGLTWTLEYATATGAYGPSVYLNSISFSGSTGFVAGSNGLIKKYTDATSGLVSPHSEKAINVYPNPIQQYSPIFIEGVSENSTVEIFNIIGGTITLVPVQNSQIIINLPVGAYTLLIHDGGYRYFKRVVIL